MTVRSGPHLVCGRRIDPDPAARDGAFPAMSRTVGAISTAHGPRGGGPGLHPTAHSLRLPQILPVSSVVAPVQPGASPPSVPHRVHEMGSIISGASPISGSVGNRAPRSKYVQANCGRASCRRGGYWGALGTADSATTRPRSRPGGVPCRDRLRRGGRVRRGRPEQPRQRPEDRGLRRLRGRQAPEDLHLLAGEHPGRASRSAALRGPAHRSRRADQRSTARGASTCWCSTISTPTSPAPRA